VAVLKVEKLTKVFPPTEKGGAPTRALDGIDLELAGHTFVSLVGPSGCGKSTLLNILSGVEEPSGGRITVTGEEGNSARFGYVFQDPRLLPWRTVLQNMLFVHRDRGESTRKRVREYLEMVGLEQTADMYPAQLSGGMQQRVGIARAFSVDPDLLLMDEPFSHLDAITARSLRDQLQEIWNETQKTVLFVTHDVMEAVQLSENIIVMTHDGRIHADFEIDLPHPRSAADPEVAALQAKILGEFEKIQATAGGNKSRAEKPPAPTTPTPPTPADASVAGA
jgi:NitT/TauT family transport system ATP-binding protein